MEKIRPKNSTTKPLSTLSVSCMKIQRGHGPPLPPILPTPMPVRTLNSSGLSVLLHLQ